MSLQNWGEDARRAEFRPWVEVAQGISVEDLPEIKVDRPKPTLIVVRRRGRELETEWELGARRRRWPRTGTFNACQECMGWWWPHGQGVDRSGFKLGPWDWEGHAWLGPMVSDCDKKRLAGYRGTGERRREGTVAPTGEKRGIAGY